MPLELAKVPQILSMLNLTDEQKKTVDAYAKEQKMFFGEAAIKKGFITEEALQSALLEQSRQKAVAAEKDIEIIATKGTQEKPPFLKANFGNNGVNKAIENPTLVDAAQSAGNIAQNIVMIANDHPELAKELKPSVEAASRLSQALADPKKAAELSTKDRDALIKQATDGLRTALEKSGEVAKDGKGQPISLDEFINNRSAEITKGHELGVAAAALKSLDIGRENADGSITTRTKTGNEPWKEAADKDIGRAEMNRLTTVPMQGAPWSKADQKANEERSANTMAALDTDNNGLDLADIQRAAKAAGIRVDAEALKTVLESGQLASPNIKKTTDPAKTQQAL